MPLNNLLLVAIEASIVAGNRILDFFKDDIQINKKDDNSPVTLADLESNRIIIKYLETTKIPILSEENIMVSYSVRKNWERFWLIDPLDGTKEFINMSDEFTVNIALMEKNLPILGIVYLPVSGIIYYADKYSGSYRAFTNRGKLYTLNSLKNKIKLTINTKYDNVLRLVASKSHLSEKTASFIKKVENRLGTIELSSFGSSLKFCRIAEGSADIYPRFEPSMEWDIAASMAIIEYSGAIVSSLPQLKPLEFNKADLHNPSFIVYPPYLEVLIKSVIDEM